MAKKPMAKAEQRPAKEPWVTEFEAMFGEGVTRVYLLLTPAHAQALARGEVPEMVKGEAAMLTRHLEA